MSRSAHCAALSLMLLGLAPHAPASTDTLALHQDDRRPNLVLILADDLGWKDLGCTGSTTHETPHLDRLAEQGLAFTRAYSNGPNCAPSRAAILSGLYAPRTGVYTVGTSARGKARDRRLVPVPNRVDLDESFVTLAESLRAAGYRTAHFGKWHLGADPTAQGFEINVGGNRSGSPAGGYFAPWKNPDLPPAPEGSYLPEFLAEQAAARIEAWKDEAFFLYFSTYAVHTPIQAPAADVAYFQEKPEREEGVDPAYAAMVRRYDGAVGTVLAALDRNGLAENTLVVFTSDNGGHGPVTSMAPLRGAKGMLYEGGIRVPLIARWPGRIRAGATCAEPVIGMDLYPTLLAAAKAPRETEPALDGESLLPLFGEPECRLAREALYWHFPCYLEAAGKGPGPWRTTPAGAVIRRDLKLVEFFEDGRRELYDLGSDPSESRDLADERGELAAEMAELLTSWRQRLGAPLPTASGG